jgi:hypothetical protein
MAYNRFWLKEWNQLKHLFKTISGDGSYLLIRRPCGQIHEGRVKSNVKVGAVKLSSNTFEVRERIFVQGRRIKSNFRIESMLNETLKIGLIKHSEGDVDLYLPNELHNNQTLYGRLTLSTTILTT